MSTDARKARQHASPGVVWRAGGKDAGARSAVDPWQGSLVVRERVPPARNTRGFTLIELLVTVGIIGVLAAIAVPQYTAYRRQGFDARANVDIRNAAIAQEAKFTTSGSYAQCVDSACNDPTLPGFHLSDTVTLFMFRLTIGGGPVFLALTWSDSGSAGTIFIWRSDLGGML